MHVEDINPPLENRLWSFKNSNTAGETPYTYGNATIMTDTKTMDCVFLRHFSYRQGRRRSLNNLTSARRIRPPRASSGVPFSR